LCEKSGVIALVLPGLTAGRLAYEIPRGPTLTGIQHKSFRIPIGIWNLGKESEIFSEMKS